jgi:hypothetical protein
MEPQSPAAGLEATAAPVPATVAERTGPTWRFLLTPRWLGWHLLMVVSFWGMLWLGDWQFHRAMSGNALSWAYTFEWPLFAGFVVVFWARTIRDEFRLRRDGVVDQPEDEPELPAAIAMAAGDRAAALIAQAEEDDPELSAYNAYLARLNTEVKGHGKWHGLR